MAPAPQTPHLLRPSAPSALRLLRTLAHGSSDPGPAALTAFFMVAAILDWTTRARVTPRGPSRALLSQTPLKHNTVSTLLPPMSLTYEFPGKGLGKENYDLETLGIFQLKGQAAPLSAGLNTKRGQ